MHPVICKGLVICTLTLCDLIFMVWEDQVFTACMNIDLITQIMLCHNRTLNMPAIEDRPSYDEDMMSIALAGITQRQKKKRSRTYTFVQKRSIDFTEEIWSIIEAHRKLPGIQDNLRETIYKGLLLLKEKENL